MQRQNQRKHYFPVSEEKLEMYANARLSTLNQQKQQRHNIQQRYQNAYRSSLMVREGPRAFLPYFCFLCSINIFHQT